MRREKRKEKREKELYLIVMRIAIYRKSPLEKEGFLLFLDNPEKLRKSSVETD
jgi:hypothetical protein